MATFGTGGRDLTGWAMLLELHGSVYAKEELATLEGRILYERQMPFTAPDMGSPLDLRAGTCIQWNLHEDMLDHHWEMRRMDRVSPAWRALLPSRMDATGYSDADCWIEFGPDRVVGVVHRDEGEDTESTLRILHRPSGENAWETTLEVSFVWDDPLSDALVAIGDPEVLGAAVESRGWRLRGNAPLQARMEDGEMVVVIPTECLGAIDGEENAPMDETDRRS